MSTIIEDARTHLPSLDAEPLREADSLTLSAAAYFDLSPVAGVRARLGAVYNHDGPGSPDEALDDFSPIRHIFHKTVPQSALVGLLMSSPRRARVVRATANGVLAHYPYTWRIEDGDFVDRPLNEDARGFDRRLTRSLATHPREEAELLVEALYGVATSSSTETVPEMVAAFAADLPFFARSFTSMGREAHAVLRGAILDLLPFPGR